MTDKSRYALYALFAAALAAGAPGCGGSGGDGNAPAEERETDPVKRRMNDPKFVADLERRHERRRQIMVELDGLKKNLAEVEASGAGREAAEAVEAKIKEKLAALERERKSALEAISARIRAETEPAPAGKSGAKKN